MMEYQVILSVRTENLSQEALRAVLAELLEDMSVFRATVEITQVSEPYDLK